MTATALPMAAWLCFSWDHQIAGRLIEDAEALLEHDRGPQPLASHCFLVFRFSDRTELIEARQPRVQRQLNPALPRANSRSYALPPSADLGRMYRYAAAHVGEPYDTLGIADVAWWLLFRHKDWWYQHHHGNDYCSELGHHAVLIAGADVLPDQPPCQTTPAALEIGYLAYLAGPPKQMALAI